MDHAHGCIYHSLWRPAGKQPSAAKAVDLFHQRYERRVYILLGLDFKKCFDCINPELGRKCFRHLGCPSAMLKMLILVWKTGGAHTMWSAACYPCVSSLLQGDAASPLALSALLTARTSAEPLQLVTYFHDRNMIASNPQQAFRLWHTS